MNIPQVKLLKGSHAETGQTGQGCFMNVIAYLNNEPIITDESECVCFVMRPLFIWSNDWMTDEERPQLLPFILRAMGSRTNDKSEVSRRLALVVTFANEMAKYAKSGESAAKYAVKYAVESAEYAEYAAECAVESAAKSAEYAPEYAAKYGEYAAEYAKSAAKYAAKSAAEYAAKYGATRKQIIASLMKLFDSALPPLENVGEQTVKRIRQLEALAA